MVLWGRAYARTRKRKPEPDKWFEAKNRPETARKLVKFCLKYSCSNLGAVGFDMN